MKDKKTLALIFAGWAALCLACGTAGSHTDTTVTQAKRENDAERNVYQELQPAPKTVQMRDVYPSSFPAAEYQQPVEPKLPKRPGVK